MQVLMCNAGTGFTDVLSAALVMWDTCLVHCSTWLEDRPQMQGASMHL